MNDNNFNNINQNNNGTQYPNNNMNQSNSGTQYPNNNMNQGTSGIQYQNNNMNQNSSYQSQYQNNTIVQPSTNPGYQVNNGMNVNQNGQPSYPNQITNNSISTKGKTKFPIIIIIVVLGFFGLVIGGSFILNIITLPFSTKIINDNISQAKLNAAKESAYGYIDAFDKYVALSNYDTTAWATYVKLPTSQSGIVKCSKIDSDIWSGEVLATSSSCDDFLNAVNNSVKGRKITGGEIIFNKDGSIQDNSYFLFENIKCTYNNSLVTCEKFTNKTTNTTTDSVTTTTKFTKDEENTVALVDAVEHYVLLNSMFSDTEGYEIPLPTTKSGTVICSKTNGAWTGEVLKGSSTCAEFMNKIETTIIGDNPTGGKVIISKDGEVLKGTWLNYGNNYCNYDGENATCSVKK